MRSNKKQRKKSISERAHKQDFFVKLSSLCSNLTNILQFASRRLRCTACIYLHCSSHWELKSNSVPSIKLKKNPHPWSFTVLYQSEKTNNKKRTQNIGLLETDRESEQHAQTHLFSDYKSPPSLSVLTDSKACSHKKINNDGQIHFLCIGRNPLLCGSIFYAWVTARKQSLLVLSSLATQEERKSFTVEAVEMGGEEQKSLWLEVEVWRNFRSQRQQKFDSCDRQPSLVFIDLSARPSYISCKYILQIFNVTALYLCFDRCFMHFKEDASFTSFFAFWLNESNISEMRSEAWWPIWCMQRSTCFHLKSLLMSSQATFSP